jgi:hypothetical protein
LGFAASIAVAGRGHPADADEALAAGKGVCGLPGGGGGALQLLLLPLRAHGLTRVEDTLEGPQDGVAASWGQLGRSDWLMAGFAWVMLG